jgi:hypothetical protein
MVVVGRFADFNVPHQELMRSYTDKSPAIAKVTLVGKEKTIEAVANFSQLLTAAFLRLSANVKLFVNSSDFYVAALLHESFHAYQGMATPERLAAAETAAIRHGDRYPTGDTAVQEAWQVGLDLLADAVARWRMLRKPIPGAPALEPKPWPSSSMVSG